MNTATAEVQVRVFESAGFGSIRIIVENDEILAVAADVAKSLGYRDAEKMVRSLDEDEKGTHFVGTPGGKQSVRVITEAGLYHAINMRRAACVRDPEARARVEAFQRWVNHEVLPAIRQTGTYTNPQWQPMDEETEEIILSRAVLIAQRNIASLEATVEAMRPMAELGAAVSASEGSISIGDLARLLRQNGCEWAGRNRLFARLREDGYLNSSRSCERNRPIQKWLEAGLFEIRERTYERNGVVEIGFTTMVTPKGQAYFLRIYAGVGADVGA